MTAPHHRLTPPDPARMNPRDQDGVIVGNVYDKYSARNPLVRALMAGFFRAVTDLYRRAAPTTVLEVGCGEGHLAAALYRAAAPPARFVATDLLDARAPGLPPAIEFQPASIYALPFPDRAFDLVVCCEVLEHLERPAQALAELCRVADRHILLSVPWEPIWRALNLARGRYLRDLGNTPGHLQHFSRRQFHQLTAPYLDSIERRRPLPWTVLLGAPRR
jgi:ubiquinone/menaquinone biosynthesis C-methylase UbiE